MWLSFVKKRSKYILYKLDLGDFWKNKLIFTFIILFVLKILGENEIIVVIG